jgi:hypothetical protein
LRDRPRRLLLVSGGTIFRTDTHHTRVRDRSRLRRHFATRVRIGSNGAKGFDAHARWCAAQSSGASAWMVGAGEWMEARAREVDARLRGATAVRAMAMGERRGRMGSTLTCAALFIGGSTGSACCGSFCHTTRLNGSIPIILREDYTGFIISRLSHDLNSEFRLTTANKTSSGHLEDKQD